MFGKFISSNLELGLWRPLNVRTELIGTGRSAPFKLAYVADIHLRRNRSQTLIDQIVAAIVACEPHLILLGGDLVDQVSELGHLANLVRLLSLRAKVLAIGGNHDRQIGLRRVAQAVHFGGGGWIHDSTELIDCDQRTISISGPAANQVPDADYRVLCAHYPSDWNRPSQAPQATYDLVVAGHLHGCQMVAFEWSGFLFPGALFYSQCCLHRKLSSTTLIVSRGVSDLIPIRWRCPREVVLCLI